MKGAITSIMSIDLIDAIPTETTTKLLLQAIIVIIHLITKLVDKNKQTTQKPTDEKTKQLD